MKPSAHIFTLNASTPFIPAEEKQEWMDQNDLLAGLKKSLHPKVIIADPHSITNPDSFLMEIVEAQPDSILILSRKPTENLDFLPSLPFFNGVLGDNEIENKSIISKSLERISEANQESDLIQLLKGENSKLKAQLSEFLDDNQKSTLSKPSSKAHLRMKTLENSLIEILKARSVPEIERALKKSLSKILPLNFVRVVFNHQSSLLDSGLTPLHIKIPLTISQSRSKGWLILGLELRKVISEKDHELLDEVAEIASLSVLRILQLEESESLKQQWDATFDAISDPLCLVDESMRILRTNRAFSSTVGKEFSELIGENSLKIFFKDNPEVWKTPPPLNLKIQIQNHSDGKSYNLVIHDLGFQIHSQSIHLLLIKDVTDQMRIEKHIREKSKLVELGTIGSSIAHELNNPLAGMLSYLQLILMDVEKNSDFYEDLKEMERATLRCRDIVQSLLGFSRKQSHERKSELDLNELIHKAVQLVEIKSRFKKVQILFKPLKESAFIHGDHNSLMQAITHILTNSIEALEDRLLNEPDHLAKINILLSLKNELYILRITDNGPGILAKHLPQVINPLFTTKTDNHHAGLGLTVAYSIFSEHNGTLEIESRPGQGVTAIISLPRPEKSGSSRGIDTQI